MVNPDYWYVLDTSSGTYFCLSGAVLINSADLSSDEIEILEEGSDSDRNKLAIAKGDLLPDAINWSKVGR